jgi:hypothetical protein
MKYTNACLVSLTLTCHFSHPCASTATVTVMSEDTSTLAMGHKATRFFPKEFGMFLREQMCAMR